jgi:LCP family protein required for cell wall assembly
MDPNRPPKQRFFKRIAAGFRNLSRIQQVVLVAFLVTGMASALVTFSVVRQFVVSTTSFRLPGLALTVGGTDEAGASLAPAQQLAPLLTEWDGTSRVNILIMGLDARDWEAGNGPPRTDSMMLFTYDPVTKTAGMLSIPRDLWVDIPGFGHNKINAAYQLGEGAHLPGGGAGLAVKTVEQFLGITINYYAQIDFYAFVHFIDFIGGVKVDVPSDIRVDIIGQSSSVAGVAKDCTGNVYTSNGCTLIKSGRQVLSGDLALAYARARHTGDGDYDRARRQQQVILAIRQQLMRDDVRSLLISHIFEIYQELSNGINTNMTLDEMMKLAFTLRNVDPSEITQDVISPPDFVIPDKSPDGLDILKPITEKIRELRDRVFSSGSLRSAVAINSESVQLVQAEAAKVAVNNGSGVSGLADNTSTYLQGQGFTIVSTGNADLVGATRIIDYTGNPYTVQYLVDLLGVSPANIYSRYDPTSQIDVEVIIGPEWTVPTQ